MFFKLGVDLFYGLRLCRCILFQNFDLLRQSRKVKSGVYRRIDGLLSFRPLEREREIVDLVSIYPYSRACAARQN